MNKSDPLQEYDTPLRFPTQSAVDTCRMVAMQNRIGELEALLGKAEADLHNTNVALKREYEENQRVRMALMPILESEDPAEAVEALKQRAETAEQTIEQLWGVIQYALKWIPELKSPVAYNALKHAIATREEGK